MRVGITEALCASLLAACAPVGPGPGPGRPACELTETVAPIVVSEGGRVEVALPVSAAVASVFVNDAPAGWTIDVLQDPLRFRPRAPYGDLETHRVTLSLDCPGTFGAAQVEVSSRPLRWSEVTPWSAPAGPSTREHPYLWYFGSAPDRLFLLGGYLFEPRQFTRANDLWSLAADGP